jgi:DNA-binding NtrC family response regulator
MDLYKCLQGMKVVLIEDDQWIQNGLRMFFQYHGCELLGFENATLAKDMLRKERVDIILCDYWLPDMDGLTLLGQIRKQQPDAITILITAYPTADLRDRAVQMGFDDFIEKPLTVGKLEECLTALILKSPSAMGGSVS